MRGQVAIFIIIGALVLIAFGITLYATSQVRTASNQPKELERLGAQPIRDYANSCLNLAATEGLRLLGLQGGMIFKEQGGIHDIPGASASVNGTTVPFAIVEPTGNVGELFFSEPPKYPFETFPYAGGKLLFKGYYGKSRLPPLYKLSEGGYVEGSVQESLESFIATQTPACASWDAFNNKGYKVVTGSANASLVFATSQEQFEGERFVSVNLKWPVEVTTPGGDKSLVSDFAVRLPVRLATSYYTAKQVIDDDVTDVSYVPSSSKGILASRIQSEGFTMISLRDTNSRLGNDVFEWRIARKNRLPALWFVNTSVLDDATFHVTPEGRGAKITVSGNILRIEDPCQEPGVQNPLLLELKASDPDEDDVVFEVHGTDSEDEIPSTAIGQPFSITVGVHDIIDENVEDSQRIPLEIALCEVR